jgi:hypothetical protein
MSVACFCLFFLANAIFLLEGVTTAEQKDTLENMNARVPFKTLLEARKTVGALGIKMQRFVLFSLKLGLFFLQHLGWQEGGEVVEDTFAVQCGQVFRNFAAKRGFNTEKLTTLDGIITDFENFTKQEG